MSFNLSTKINNLYQLINGLIAGSVSNPMTSNLNANGFDIINVGDISGNFKISTDPIAIGINAGFTGQSSGAVAIGSNAGRDSQGPNSIAIGNTAGQTGQVGNNIAIGPGAGNFFQGQFATAIGLNAGQNNQGVSAIAIGGGAGQTGQSDNAVSVGQQAGQTQQGISAVSIGYQAGQLEQGISAVSIGVQAGQNTQGISAVAIGVQAGGESQGDNSVAVGRLTAYVNQKPDAVAIGNEAGYCNQKTGAVAIGVNAGRLTQSLEAVAIGSGAGQSNQGTWSVAIGQTAGQSNQGYNSVAVGSGAGALSCKTGAVCIGGSAGLEGAGENSVAVGRFAGYYTSGYGAVSIGINSGFQDTGGDSAVSVGNGAGTFFRRDNAIGIGKFAGQNNHGTNAIAVGAEAGRYSQGTNAIAIGYLAGCTGQHENSVVINASGTGLNSEASNRTYMRPIRETAQIDGKILHYDKNSGELKYSDNVSHINNVDIANLLITNSLIVSATGTTNIAGSLSVDTNTFFVNASNNRVGIGTTGPFNNLNVVGNGAIIQVEDSTPVATGLTGTGGQISFGGQYRNAGDNVVGAYIKASKTNGVIGDYGHDLVFANITYPTTLTEKMIIKSNGRVGIGTTTPETRLDVVGNSIQCSNQGRFKGWYSGGQGSGLATEIGISSSEGFLIAYDRTANTYAPLNLVAGSGANIKLLTNGNVGIGTDNPNYKLHVEGSGTANEIVGWFNNQGTFSSSIAVRQSSKTAYISNHYGLGTPAYDGQLSNAISFGVSSGASPIQFYNGNTGVGLRGTAKMTILENGNVGIGTNAPSSTLDVNGDTFRLRTARTPASSGAAGNAGDICWDANYVYVCIATNTWKRSAISTW